MSLQDYRVRGGNWYRLFYFSIDGVGWGRAPCAMWAVESFISSNPLVKLLWFLILRHSNLQLLRFVLSFAGAMPQQSTPNRSSSFENLPRTGDLP